MTIFISYAPDDRAVAEKLHADLKRNGLNPWMADADLLPGQKKEETIRRTIKQSSYFLAVLSAESFSRRGAIHKEIRQALDLLDEFPDSDVFVIPVRTEECAVTHEKLENLVPVDLFPDYSKGVERLLVSLSRTQNPVKSEPAKKKESQEIKPDTGKKAENMPEIQDKTPAWVLKVSVGSALAFLICLMILAVFIPDPKPFQIFVFRVVLALAAAGFGATIPGFLKVELPLWKKGLISAICAIALFVVVYKVNPPELIHQPAPQIAEQKIKQPLSGVIVDEKGNPLPDVKVMIQGFDVEKMTNDKGSFSFEIEAEKEKSVKLTAQKQGFETLHRYVSLGNTSFSIPMKKQISE